MKFQLFVKSLFDFVVALIVLILISPLFLIVAILIKFDSPGPIFFRQERVGKNQKIFKIWKFRTMIVNAQNQGLGHEVTKDDYRITKIGKFLRRFGIDELPQFINVILGEMSIVGPRAALVHQVAKYSDFEKRRLEVNPGITNINVAMKGWNTLSWKERIKWDIWYIDNWSLWLDLKILVKTPIIVLLGRGQYGKDNIVEDYK